MSLRDRRRVDEVARVLAAGGPPKPTPKSESHEDGAEYESAVEMIHTCCKANCRPVSTIGLIGALLL